MNNEAIEKAEQYLISLGIPEEKVKAQKWLIAVRTVQDATRQLDGIVTTLISDIEAGKKLISTISNLYYDITTALMAYLPKDAIKQIGTKEDAEAFAVKMYEAIRTGPEEVAKVEKEILLKNQENRLAYEMENPDVVDKYIPLGSVL